MNSMVSFITIGPGNSRLAAEGYRVGFRALVCGALKNLLILVFVTITIMQNCPNIIASGSCPDTHCIFNHNIPICDPCGYVACDYHEYQAHLQSKKHKKVLMGNIHQTWYCRICQRPINSESWVQHKNAQRHRNKAKLKGLDANLEPDPVVPSNTHTFCTVCHLSITTFRWHSHIHGRSHLAKERYASFKSVLDEAEKEKNGVAIEGQVDLGILEPGVVTIGKTTTLKISSNVPSAKITLVSVKLSADLGVQTRNKVASPSVFPCRSLIQST